MNSWKTLQDMRWGWKVVGIISAVIGGLFVWVQVPIRENAEDHGVIRSEVGAVSARVDHVKAIQDTVLADLGLVRCWVRHEIQNTDATVCLVEDGGRGR